MPVLRLAWQTAAADGARRSSGSPFDLRRVRRPRPRYFGL